MISSTICVGIESSRRPPAGCWDCGARRGSRSPSSCADDVAAQRFVRQAEIAEEMLVEKMAERAVAHVVQQAGHAQQRLDIAAAGHVGADFAQAVVQCRGRPAGQVHHAQHVLEAGVLGRGIDPPGGLQLMDLPQPLDPGMVDDLPFRDFALGQPRRRRTGCSRERRRG